MGGKTVKLESRDTAERSALTKLLTSRELLYMLFHKLFGGVPTVELIDFLTSAPVLDAVGVYASESRPMRLVRDFLKGFCDMGADALIGSIRDEYTRLFIGPAELIAYPWESPYLTHVPSAFQESTLAVRDVYRQHGFEPRHLLRVPDDHISIMCMFMAKMSRRSLAALGNENFSELSETLRAQEAFLREHINSWLADYASASRASKTAVLYPQMIEACSEFAKADAVFLSESAFWAEEYGSQDKPSNHGANAAEDTPVASVFETDRNIETLASIQLLGIEENELIEIIPAHAS